MGTMYLKDSTAKLNFPETSSSDLKQYNGTILTLEVDSCGACETFPMSYKNSGGEKVISNYSKDVLQWIDTKQVDY